MTALNDRFWARVLFKEFIKHYRKLTDEQIVADVRQSMDDLEELVDNTTSFGSQMVRWSMERAERYPQASENGKKGGRPRKDKESTAGAPTREDGVKPEGVRIAPKAESGTPAKPSLAYAGRGGNVHLTDDEYNMLLQELGNKRKADKLIDSLDYAISEGKTYNAPHFHVLMHWNDYREEKAAEAAETAKARAAANAEAFGNVDRRTPFQKNQDELHQLYVLTSEKLKELK